MAVDPESTALIRSWRTSFLTLRDETLSHPSDPLARILPLLDELILNHLPSFIDASRYLPRHEVTSDLIYLLNLAASRCGNGGGDAELALARICRLIHNVGIRARLDVASSTWSHMLELFSKLVKYFIGSSVKKRALPENSSAIKAIMDCLEVIRHLAVADPQRCSVTDNIHLIEFLLGIVICCHSKLDGCYHHGGARGNSDLGNRFSQWNDMWKVQTTVFGMIGEAFVRVGSSLPVELWHSVVEVLRKVMDTWANKMSLEENDVLSRFYVSLLHCLHLVIINRKGSLSDHVAAFVATLKMFLGYGLSSSSMQSNHNKGDPGSLNWSSSTETTKKDGAYRPPHLRRRKSSCSQQRVNQTSQASSDHDSSPVEYLSSDSDFSDSDGTLRSYDKARSCKARIAAMTCIQDLCEVDRKAFVAHWTMLLPTSDVLLLRRYEATLMTSLMFDPFLKARLASASTIAAMLEGQSAIALQVAEYREATKLGSYMALSSCLGQILMQLHSGVLHLVQQERHTGLLTSLFKILILLISSTPYSRMPGELLPRVLSSLKLKIEEGFPSQNDQTSFLVSAISCLIVAASTSPPSLPVSEMFQAEISEGLIFGKGKSGVLCILFQHAEQISKPTICLEALQALKAVCHNYPNVMAVCWKRISSMMLQFLRPETFRVPLGKGPTGQDAGSILDKVVTAAVKVMDECLRAVSGFKGTEDILGDNLLETPFASDYVREKKISSAPSHGLEVLKVSEDMSAGCTEWCEAIDKLLILSISHPSGMVRAASVTCFAGITCSVYFSLGKQQQQFILSSTINAANEPVASVRSAACRAIGVIICFPGILKSSEVLHKFMDAVEVNTRDQLVSVRITASWAVANICDSFSHGVSDCSLDIEANFQLLATLLDCALRLARDGDKVKSNAVRALGNLSRVIPFVNPLDHGQDLTCPENSVVDTFSSKCCLIEQNAIRFSSLDCLRSMRLLETIVRTFLSCITTGNVKVQWNACHALSNLFQNESLSMLHREWASSLYRVLLLLLRDSPNFKIRIQAAAALAVPSRAIDYGTSFSDVVRGIEHILENVIADRGSSSNFKYRVALEKQLTGSMLHVLGLCSSSSDEPMKEFLVKKALFFEGWLKDLCSSLDASSGQDDSYRNEKRELVCDAIRSLVEVYESMNHSGFVQKLQSMVVIFG